MAGSPPQIDPSSTPEERPRLRLLPAAFKEAKRSIVILSLALAGCQAQITPPPTPQVVSLRLVTDSATAPLLQNLVSGYRPSHMIIAWEIQVGESSTVIDWLRAGSAPYALLNVPPGGLDERLWATPVGQNALAVIVHPSNPISDFTAAQLRGILQGQIDTWRTVGGSNVPITVISRPAGSSDLALVQTIVLGERRISANARLAPTSQAVIDIVSSTPGAIGFVSVGYTTDQIQIARLDGQLPVPTAITRGLYPLTAPMVFAGTHEPSNDAYRAFFAWVQGAEGQAIVGKYYGSLSRR